MHDRARLRPDFNLHHVKNNRASWLRVPPKVEAPPKVDAVPKAALIDPANALLYNMFENVNRCDLNVHHESFANEKIQQLR